MKNCIRNEKLREFTKQKYNINISEIKRLEGGFRNICYKVRSGRKKYTLIIYKKEKGIKKLIENAHFVAEHLNEKGFPVRIPKKSESGSTIIRVRLPDGYHYCVLYNYLPGTTIPWEAYTRRHIKSIGKTLSDIHYALRGVKNSQLPYWTDLCREEIGQMQKYFLRVEPWIERKLSVKLNWGSIEEIFKMIEQRLATSSIRENVLHYDFVRGNILFSDKLDKELDICPITGVLDFEKVCLGHELVDVARTLAFLIIDCKYKKEAVVRKRFLESGYNKRGRNSLHLIAAEENFFEYLLAFFWLRDFWKFLLHNPYEDLYLNEHYKRTRNKLLGVDLLCSI